jgi:signal peptidase I
MRAQAEPKHKEGGLKGAVRFWLSVLVLFLAFRILLFQPFHIPSESMKTTLLVGDSLFVSKFSYGYSRYSLPFSPPLFSGRILGSQPRRGDIAVFRLPRDDSQDLIKRVIGLPGDRIQMIGGWLHLNGEPVKRERIADYVDPEEPVGGRMPVKRWRETLPNGASYSTLDLVDRGGLDDTPVYAVPPGHYFMMGDNRDDSADSRVGEVGYVPFENIVGRAEIIYFSIGEGAHAWQVWRWPWAMRWRRIFTILR